MVSEKPTLARVQESVENLILHRSKDFQQELDSIALLAGKQEITVHDLDNNKINKV
jgi:hypothetical protein